MAGTEAQPLVYEQLPDATRYIRLLQFESSSDDNIHCRMTAHRLDDAPPYAALSYTWGEPMPTQPISVNGLLFHCRSSCHYVLWQVRRLMSLVKHSISSGDVPLLRFGGGDFALENVERHHHIWIDSICINQQDLSERSCQVSQMGNIYKSARQVLVGLGEGDESSRVVAAVLEQPPSKSALLGTKAGSPGAGDAVSKTAVADNTTALEPLSADDPHRLYLEDLVHHVVVLSQRPYWTRVWIVQELGYAKHFVLLCGQDAFDGSQLMSLYDNLRGFGYDLLKYVESRPTHRKPNISDSSLHCFWFFLLVEKRRRSDIGSLLTIFDRWQCSNPLDRIHGFHSLIDWNPNVAKKAPSTSIDKASKIARRVEPIYPGYSRSLLQLAYMVLSYAARNRIRMHAHHELLLAPTQLLLKRLRLDASDQDVAELVDRRRRHSGELRKTSQQPLQARTSSLPQDREQKYPAPPRWSPDHGATALFHVDLVGALLTECESDKGFTFEDGGQTITADDQDRSPTSSKKEVGDAVRVFEKSLANVEMSLVEEDKSACSFWCQEQAIGLLPRETQQGDFLVSTDLRTSSGLSIWLVLRRQIVCYEIMGQALMIQDWRIGPLVSEIDSRITALFSLRLQVEDLVVLIFQSALHLEDNVTPEDLYPTYERYERTLRERAERQYTAQEHNCHFARLRTMFTRTRFSSFAALNWLSSDFPDEDDLED